MEQMGQRRVLEADRAVVDADRHGAGEDSGSRYLIVDGWITQHETLRRLRTDCTSSQSRLAGRDDVGERDDQRLGAGCRIDRHNGSSAKLIRADITLSIPGIVAWPQ